MSILISLLASLAAFLGGYVALRFKDRLHLVIGLSAGAVIGAALFDLIPEAIELGKMFFSAAEMTSFTAFGFLLYLILDRAFSFHAHDGDTGNEGHSPSSHLGPASFFLHSLIDGIAIGTAFQVSTIIGATVAIAVIAHRFSDGINTVGLILKNRGKDSKAYGWLLLVALAPLLGTASTFLFSISDGSLAVLLAVFAGFFLYIAGSDLIPEGHHSHSKVQTTVMTLIGAGILYLIVNLVA